jgi:hypothetical protein
VLRGCQSSSVDVDDQLAVRCAGGVEFLVAVVELASEFGDELFELGDAMPELVDVDGRAQAGFAPSLFAIASFQPRESRVLLAASRP